MTTASTDPRDIEAELERDRAQLASTLDELSDRVSVDSLARDALATVKSYAGSYTSTVDHAVRANPLAVALIGAGIAWLAFGGRARAALSGSREADQGFMGHPVHDELPRWESEGGSPPERGVAYRPTTSQGDRDEGGWLDAVRELRERAGAALERIERDAAAALRRAREGLSGGAGSARDFAAERASVVSGFASDLRGRLSQGLEALPEPARERVVAARERAYAAMLKAERAGRDAVTDPVRAMEEHPIAAGAVAFALGAALAAMLPRTEAEDRAFGAERDRLMAEAQRMFRLERDRAREIAGSLAGEVKAAAAAAAGSVVETAKQAATEAAGQVADTARHAATDAASRVGERASEEADRLADGSRRDPVIG